MKVKFYFFRFMTLLVFCAAVLFYGTDSQAKTIRWTMVTPLTPAISYVPLYAQMAKNIEERSQGRLQIAFLTFGQHPYKGADIVRAVKDNMVQIGNTTDAYFSGMEPALSIMALPFRYASLDHAKAVYDQMLPRFFNPFLGEKYDAFVLTGFLVSGSAIHADIPLTSSDALKGRKIRVFGKESGDMIRFLGGTPVSVAFGELYTALQMGTINGCLTGMIGAEAGKIYEVVNNVTWWNWSFPWEFTMVSKKAFDALPSDLQEIVMEEGLKSSMEIQAHQDRMPPEILVRSMETYGISAHGLPKPVFEQFNKITQPITDEWLDRTGIEGKKAFEIYEEVTKSIARN